MWKLTDKKTHFILASASPRRRELLLQAGVPFEVVIADVDESELENETPEDLVRRLSLNKANEIAQKNKNAWVLGADTIVVFNNQVLGKPSDEQDAVNMLGTLQGQTHTVFGGIALVNIEQGFEEVQCHISEVKITPMSEVDIKKYISTHEPMDKAGSYAIQGLGSQFVSAVDGSYTNVVGLNLEATINLLRKYKVITFDE